MNERDQDRAAEQVEGQCPMCGAPAVSSHSRQGRIGLTSWRYQAPAPAAALREALLNVSVHSAHLPGAPHELLIELLAKCGQIARVALTGGDHE